MNVDAIKRNVREEYGDVDFGASRETDEGLRLVIKTNPREVTESHIEADFHQTHTEYDDKFVVIVDPETSEIIREDEIK